MSAKNPGPKLIDRRLGAEDPIPVEFRAAMERIQEEQTNPTDVAPETLSDTIIESRVEWDTRNELKRITVKKKAGNIVLVWYDSNESGQLAQITRTLFPTGTAIDTPSLTKSVIVRDLGNGWSVQESSVEGSLSGATFTPGFATRYGQDYNPRLDSIIPWTETTVAPAASGTARTEIRPIDFMRQRNRTYDLTAITAAYNASVIEFPGKTVVDLPDVLTSITATYNKSSGSGASNHPVSQQAFSISNGGSAGLSPKATAQGSAAIIADVTWNITNYRGIQVDCQHYYFYLTGTATLAQVLAKLAAIPSCGPVSNLEVFKPQTKQIKVYGGQVSVQQSADTQVSAGWSQNSSGTVTSSIKQYEYGDAYSKEVGVSTRVLTIPPTIHAALSVGGLTSDSESVTVTVKANTMPIGPTVPVGAITNEPTPIMATVNGGVTPSSFSATSPSAIPTSGKRLVAHTGDPVDYGFTLIHAVVVDFAQYA